MKMPALKYVKFTRAKGRIYAYFNAGKKDGHIVWVTLPPWGSTGFFDSYATMMGHRNRQPVNVMTVADLIDQFQASERYKRLSVGTRETYGITLNKIRATLGVLPVDDVQRADVRKSAEIYPGNATRNIFISTVGALYRFARRDLECTMNDPARDLERYEVGQHEHWPDEILNAALASEGRIRLVVHLLYYTGQRIGDVLRMRWDHIGNSVLTVTQQKTGKTLHLPILPELAAELAQTPKSGMTIVTGAHGKQVGQEVIRQEIIAFCLARGFVVVPHGLRRNAVHAMLYAGCSADEVGSFTGQSAEIVAHYAKGISQLRMAQGVVIKLENRAGTQRDSSNHVQTTTANPQET